MNTPEHRQDWTVVILCLCWGAIGFGIASPHRPCEAAPAPKSPEIVGTFDFNSLHSPVVMLPGVNDEPSRLYWLVFTDPATEVQANKMEAGWRVRVKGKCGNGGGYSYVIVTSIERDE